MSCSIVERYPEVVQQLATAMVGTLRWIHQHTPEQIADAMPQSFAGGDRQLYVASVRDSIGMFNADGRMSAEGAQNVLTVLSSFSKNVSAHRSMIDLNRTYTTRFVDAVAAGSK
jgi:NitT/TauT family transport system substrate-binding protein